MLATVALGLTQCKRAKPAEPEAIYAGIERQFVAGELAAASAASEQVRQQVSDYGPAWQAKFELLRARVMVYQGRSQDAVKPLRAISDTAVPDRAFAISRGTLLSIALRRTGDKGGAEDQLTAAEKLCSDELACREVRLAQGIVALEGSQLAEAEHDFALSGESAKACGDAFVEMQALLDLGTVELRREHYDAALERYAAASKVAQRLGAGVAIEKATGNVGWALLKLGDYRKALENSKAAYVQAAKLGVPIDEVEWLNDAGLSQYRLGDLRGAKDSFEHSLQLARSIQNAEETSSALVALAVLSLDANELDEALDRATQAQQLAEGQGNSLDVLRPRLIHALVLSKRGDASAAQAELLSLRKDADARLSIRWETEKALAESMATAGNVSAAELWFQRAIATYREQRTTLGTVDLRLPFVENGADIFDSYMQFLIGQGKTVEALRVLDAGRAESLLENIEPRARVASSEQSLFSASAMSMAKRRDAVILIYCLRPGKSYVWAVERDHIAFQRIAGVETLTPMIERYQRAILASQELLTQQEELGSALYRELVLPVQASTKRARIVDVVADGVLEKLNFETLIVPGDKAHYWIEDVNLEVAPSMGVLAQRRQANAAPLDKNLLLIGDPVYSDSVFPVLVHAKEEMAEVESHFSSEHREVLSGAAATPEGYEKEVSAQFGYIHFVAHSVVSASAPLDSAVVLSAPAGGLGEYKLYARDILAKKLNADLVTISSCYSAGADLYSREGLVGLSWAFLRAGAHHVIGALWQVNDLSTPELMDGLYQRAMQGESPSSALRGAKLAMLHGQGVFRKPLYWAPFQIYTGN